MITRVSKFATSAALAAAISMAATPAAAVDLPHVAGTRAAVQTGAAAEQNHHGWGRHRHRDRGIDAGDVIAGVLVIGAIAAIAGAGRNRDRDRYEERYPRREDDVYRDDRRRDRDYDTSGMERAVDMCVDQVERGRDRVDEIAEARRTGDGWRVSGSLESGDGWSCWIDNDGRIRNVDIGAPGYASRDGEEIYAPAAPAGDQWDDNAYAQARANTRTPVEEDYTYRSADSRAPASLPTSENTQPAYPGGPLPGEEDYSEEGYSEEGYSEEGSSEEGSGEAGSGEEGDGRYSTADTPDFSQPGS